MTKQRRPWERGFSWTPLALLLLIGPPLPASGGEHGSKNSRISDEAVLSIDPDQVPDRPRPILDWGNNFLGSGVLNPGFRVGGAVWQPALLAFGTLRTSLQSYDDGEQTTSEWANRLDFFFNLQLSGTERLFVGLRPTGTFSGETIEGLSEGSVNDFNTDVLSLFFEGDFGELFPNVDRKDTKSADYGFSIGRQPLGYQDGMLIADSIDSLGVIENTLLPRGGSDLQLTLLYGWNDIHRGDNIEDELGHFAYLAFYLGCGLLASLAHFFANPHSTIPAVGASGAIAGVMGAYMIRFPWARVVTLIPLFFFLTTIEVPAILMLFYWFAIQFFSGAMSLGQDSMGGVAWWAHIGGFVAGAILIWSRPRRRRLRQAYYR